MVGKLHRPGPVSWRGDQGVVAHPYRAVDLRACVAVFDSNVPRFFHPEEQDEFVSFLRALPGPYFVLRMEDREVVACGGYAVREDAEAGDLCWGMVRRDLHGLGLGRALMRLRIDALQVDPRVCRVELNTSQHTVGFYHEMGFHTTSVQTDGYAPGLDRCQMRLSFEEKGS